MRNRAILLAALVVMAAVPAPAAAGILSGDTDATIQKYTAGDGLQPSFIVEYNNGSVDTLRDWASSSTNRKIIQLDNDSKIATVVAPSLHVNGGLVNFDGLDVTVNSGTSLQERSYISSVEPNYRVALPDTPSGLSESEFSPQQVGVLEFNDPQFSTSGMAFDTNETTLSETHQTTGNADLSASGTGQKVAVIDTGANTANGRVFGNGTSNSTIRITDDSAEVLNGNVTTVAEDGYAAIADGSRHGSWSAAAVGANASGTTFDGAAPDANLLVIKALADDGSGSTSDIAQGIRYAADNNASIISMSLGAKVQSDAIEDAIDYAYANGVKAVVVAAGNSRPTRGANLASPSDYAPVITVGATTTGNGTAASVESAYFSQVGPEPSAGDLGGEANVGTMPDVGAPGYQLTAKVPTTGSDTINSTLSGTSMATPLAAGSIAAAMSGNSTLSSADNGTVHDAVRDSARPARNLSTVETGQGIIAADNLATGTTPETSQEEAMTSAASQRTAFYKALSDADERTFIKRVFGQ